MPKACLLLIAVVFATSPMLAQKALPNSQADSQIRKLLEQQVAAWNRHDLEAFMSGYWHSPELTFFSGGTTTKGWEPTIQRYQQKYQANGAAMGKLEFSDLDVVQLAPKAAFATGHWHLTMPDGKHPEGLFTLVLRNFPEGWRIVHDHTSAAP